MNNKEELAEKLMEILNFEYSGMKDRYKLIVSKIYDGYEISYGAMYEAPPLNFNTLKELSDLFGTTHIDVNDYANSGCESCDWGSSYGHEIQIREIKQNENWIKELISKNLLKEYR